MGFSSCNVASFSNNSRKREIHSYCIELGNTAKPIAAKQPDLSVGLVETDSRVERCSVAVKTKS